MYGLAVMAKMGTFSEKLHIPKTFKDIDLILFVKDRALKNIDRYFWI